MEDVVCDTSTLIRLRKGGVFDCLGRLLRKVYIPQAVKAERRDPLTQQAIGRPFVETRSVTRSLPLTGIGRGEREAISLAVELGVQTFVTDDEKAFRRAQEAGLLPVTTCQVLLLAKQGGLVDSVKDVLDRMRSEGEGIEDSLYEEDLREAREP